MVNATGHNGLLPGGRRLPGRWAGRSPVRWTARMVGLGLAAGMWVTGACGAVSASEAPAVGGGSPATAARAAAQTTGGSLRGTVRNPYGYPVEGAGVWVRAAGFRVQTGADGSYVMEAVPDGTHLVEVEHAGYQTTSASVRVQAGAVAFYDVTLPVDGAAFREALDQARLRIYREGGYSPLIWFVPRLGLVVQYHRAELRTAQDRVFDMFSSVLITQNVMAPFPYLHREAALVSETVTPTEHLLRRYRRGALLDWLQQGSPSLETALAWTSQHLEFYRDGKGTGREITDWKAIQQALDGVTGELFNAPEPGGVYVPGYGLVYNGMAAPQFPPVMAMTVLAMLLSVRVPIPDGDWVFVQLEDEHALWALEAPVQTLRELVKAGQSESVDIDRIGGLAVYRNGAPWGQ